MRKKLKKAEREGIEFLAFGDLHLEEMRQHRERLLASTSLKPLFPLWGLPTSDLALSMVASGVRAFVTCLDPSHLDPKFVGRSLSNSSNSFHLGWILVGRMGSSPLSVTPDPCSSGPSRFGRA